MKTKLLSLLVAVFFCSNLLGQINPYESLGLEVEVLTLSKGKYQEFYDLDSIQQIGTVLININTDKIVGFVSQDTASQKYYIPKFSSSRFLSVDPLASLAPSWTPYRYAFNNPINYTDPDGLFETKVAAQEYAEDHDIKTAWWRRNRIREQSDGTWAIENRRDNTSTFQDNSLIDEGNTTGVFTVSLVSANDVMGGDGNTTLFRDGTELTTMRMEAIPIGGGQSFNAGKVVIGGLIAGYAIMTADNLSETGFVFSKTHRGNHRDDELQHLSDQQIAQELSNLRGRLNKAEKALKRKLTKEQKVRGKRNVQKRK